MAHAVTFMDFAITLAVLAITGCVVVAPIALGIGSIAVIVYIFKNFRFL